MNSSSQVYRCIVHAEIRLEGSALFDPTRGDTSYIWERGMRRLTMAINGFQGTIIRQDENGILAAFADAESGLLAAWEMRFRLSTLPPAAGARLGMRAGCEFGRVSGLADEIVGEPVSMAERLAEIAHEGQIITTRRVAMELPHNLRHSLIAFCSPSFPDGTLMDVQLDMSASQPRSPRPVEPYCLHLEGTDRRYLVDEESGVVSLGRDPACDLVVSNPRASRRHGWIGKVNGRFMVIDKSSNGTYVIFDDGSAHTVHNSQLALQGRGRISFGSQAHDGHPDAYRFEVRL